MRHPEDELGGGRSTGSDNLEPPASRLSFQLYFLWMLIIPALFLASAIPIVRSASFPAVSGDPFLLNPDYAFSLNHADCEIVVYGDSTAQTGLDPTVISRATGMKTCNIAQAQSVVKILGMLALDTYLKNNLPPKYIVIQFAPETLSRNTSFFWPEGLTLLLRKKSLLEALPTFIEHPVKAYQFSIWAMKAMVGSLIKPPADEFASTEAIFRSHGGLLILPKVAETHCLNANSYFEPATEWVQSLKERYTRNGTRVIINVSPLPNCSPIAPLVASNTRNVTDNSLSLFPIELFCDLDRHLTLAGAERASMELAEQLLAATKSVVGATHEHSWDAVSMTSNREVH